MGATPGVDSVLLIEPAHQPHFQPSRNATAGRDRCDPDVMLQEQALGHWAAALATGDAGRGIRQAPNRGAADRS